MATYDADFSDGISFVGDLVNHENHLYWGDSYGFVDDFANHENHLYWGDSFGFSDNFHQGEHRRSWGDTLTFSESRTRATDTGHLTDTIGFFDLWYADADFADGRWSDGISFDDEYEVEWESNPFNKRLDEEIGFDDDFVAEGSKTLGDLITFQDFWCVVADVARLWEDEVTFGDHPYAIVNNLSDPRNNHGTIPGGSGFTMVGIKKKRLHDLITFKDAFRLVNVDGSPLLFDPCHIGTIIIDIPMSWSTLTETDWMNMTEENWSELLE